MNKILQPLYLTVAGLALSLFGWAAETEQNSANAIPPGDARLAAAVVPIVLVPDAPPNERVAAQDLAIALGRLYPHNTFSLAASLPASGKAILLGQASDAVIRGHFVGNLPAEPESFAVQTQRMNGLELAIIAGADARGAAYGAYQILGQLGCGFYLSGDTLPPPKAGAVDFSGWKLVNAPLARERIVFNWHNFLSGCSTWNLPDWQKWTAQSQKMGFNAIMVHAYGNNPMAGFNFQDAAKPVGYLSTTVKGRDWSTMHVADVRNLVGGEVFNHPAFGAEAAMVPDDQRVTSARALMHDVFEGAARRDMGVYFAVDVDTPSANPQELVTLMPESARFAIKGVSSSVSGQSPKRLWLPNPDTPEGYSFYRIQVETLLKSYPQITKLVVWFRQGGTPWMTLKPEDFPPAWQKEFAAEITRTPGAEKFWSAPGLFAIGKIIRAFERALKDCRATRTHVAAGTWGFNFLPGADRFFPVGVPLIGLDYNVLIGKQQLGDAALRAPLRAVGGNRPVIPVVWAHHDDGNYMGRPYLPLPEFATKLADAKSSGFGIIHWTTRPLDLYFESLARQVWKNTKDEALRETCLDFAERRFGPSNREVMGKYMESWITGAPCFGRETSDRFIDRKLTDTKKVAAACRERLDLIGGAVTAELPPEQRQRIDYQRGLEEFIAAFHEAQAAFQESQDRLKQGDPDGARKAIAECHAEKVIELFARFSSIGGITRGEQGLVVTLNTRWLSHIVSHRQALGLDAVRINFAPTSHDNIAQSPGIHTFQLGLNHELWKCWGEAETGAMVVSTKAATHPSAKAVCREVGLAGIEIAKSFTLTLRPIMAVDSRDPAKSPSVLPAGEYRLRLLVLDPASTGLEQGVFEVEAAGQPVDRVDLFARAGGANLIAQLTYPITLKAAGVVEVKVRPVKGKVILCAAVLEPLQSGSAP